MNKNIEKLYFKLYFSDTVKVSQAAKELNVSIRSIQNYINILKQSYRIEKVKNGEYRLLEKPSLLDEKLFELFKELVFSINIDIFKNYKDEIIKIFKIKNKKIVSNFEVEFFNITQIKGLLYFINENISIKTKYKEKEYYIHPLKIGNFDLRWYLFAYDLKEDKIKTFHINSISSIITLDKNMLNKHINLNFDSKYFNNSKKKTTLKVKKEFKNYFEKEIFELEYYHIKELVEFVKKHLTMIEIEDKHLKKKVKEILLKEIETL
jgi:predicted DNA-binding transcriptional regulator YafY